MAKTQFDRRAFLRGAGATVASLGALSRAQAPSERPNVLFFFSDDHACHAISAYGADRNKTPHIDRLANEGALFENSFCTNSICAPSRAVILSGKFSHLNGVRTNGPTFDGSQTTYPKLLQRAGYQTAMFGKWHLRSHPTGFDQWSVLPGQGSYYNPDFITPDGRERIEGHSSDVIADKALNWLKNDRDPNKPFLLHCWFKAPHRNWMPAPRYLTLYDDVEMPEPPTLFDNYENRATPAALQQMEIDRHMHMSYDLKVDGSQGNNWENWLNRLTPEQKKEWLAAYGPKNEKFKAAKLEGKDLVRWKYQRYVKDYLRCVTGVDDNIGRVLKYLDESGLAKNTVVMYSSDQGFYLGEHGWYDKRWMYEESFRMPLLMRWPGKIKPGTRVKQLVQNVDYAPTLCAITGATPAPEFQGESLIPLLEGKTDGWRKSIYYHYFEFPGAHSVRRHYGVRTERYKLIFYYRMNEWELFDLKEDPQEMKSVHGDPKYAAIQKELEAELARLREKYQDNEGEPEKPLEHAIFSKCTQLRSIKDINGGWRIESEDVDGALALRPLESPARESLNLKCVIRSASDGVSNGMLAFSPKGDATETYRVGLYLRARQMVILHGTNMVSERKLDFDPAAAHALQASVDIKAKTVTLTVKGETLTAPLPASWNSIQFVGFGMNRTTTEFTAFEFEAK